MKQIFSIGLLALVSLFSSCSSDSDPFTQEERELRSLLNNEWEVVQYLEKMNSYPDQVIDIQYLLVDQLLYQTNNKGAEMILGMNKKGGFYYWVGRDETSLLEHFYYMCTTQEGNKFTGTFNTMESNPYEAEIHVHKIDTNTIRVLFLATYERNEQTFTTYEIFLLNKKNAWNETTSLSSLLKKYNYFTDFIELMGGENYERDIAQGGCQ